jgi:cytochrome c nitrite reductase small subunit
MRWLPLLCTAALGGLLGIGAVTFVYAEGASYLSEDPHACVNCHIMRGQFDSWQKASHHTVANCVDCHLPHALVPKYIGKAEHGWNHSVAFTLQNFHEPIQISRRSSQALQGNCVRCHGGLVHDQVQGVYGAPRCVRCHGDVGHGETTGLGGPLKGER